MKRYAVRIPVIYYVEMEVDAENEAHAVEEAEHQFKSGADHVTVFPPVIDHARDPEARAVFGERPDFREGVER